MATSDPRIDAYIERSATFAAPILTLLRGAVHEACPGAEETIKWGMPFFVVDGKILAHMATSPEVLMAALRGNPAAQKAFDAFSNSHRREYIEWIVEAKQEETRTRRVTQAVAQLAEGRSRHWKYQNC